MKIAIPRGFALLAASILLARADPTSSCALSISSARKMVLTAPDALRSKRKGGCPSAELISTSATRAEFQLRNQCPKSGSGMIGNYLVDLDNGNVYDGGDGKASIHSPELVRLLKTLCGSKNR